MKRLFTLLLFIGCYQISIAQFTLGAGVAVLTGDEDAFGVQARAMYQFNDDFTAGFAYSYYFEEKVGNVMDIDLQYHLINTDSGFTINPVAGIRLNTVGKLETDLHLGFFSVIPISGHHFYFEPKFVVSQTDAIIVSIGYRF